MIKIIPSIASANLLCIEREVKKAETYGGIHLDIEDGNFSPDITFGMDMIKQIRKITECKMDAHLMVSNPLKYIAPLLACDVKAIAIHLESTEYPSQCIECIHEKQGASGIALNYKTRAEAIIPYVSMIDYVLVQSSEAGDPELTFKDYTYEKIKELKQILKGTNIPIWVDGGVKYNMFAQLEEAGVDSVIMGRAIFGGEEREGCQGIR